MSKRILVVEPAEETRELVRLVLSVHGYAVDTASSADEAMLQMRRHKPDVMLVDSALPDISGWDFCEQVKHGRTATGLPMIVITPGPPLQSRIEGSCTDDVISKPFADDELLTKVRYLLHE